MDLLFTDVKCTPVEEDRRSFQVELAVQAQAVLAPGGDGAHSHRPVQHGL